MKKNKECYYRTNDQPKQRMIIIWSAVLILTGLGLISYQNNRFNTEESLKTNQKEAVKLADKINPNNASWASLTRLPGIGETRARAIIVYRENYKKIKQDKSQAYSCPEDLRRVKGIGPVTVGQNEPYLIFQ